MSDQTVVPFKPRRCSRCGKDADVTRYHDEWLCPQCLAASNARFVFGADGSIKVIMPPASDDKADEAD